MTLAGMAFVAIGFVWMIAAAFEHGFWTGLFELIRTVFGSDRYDSYDRRHGFLTQHWEDAKGPFYMIVFGAALMLAATRL